MGVVSGLALAAALCAPATARAQALRLHGTAAGGHAVSGHQKDELGFGVAGLAAGELGLTKALGLQLELGYLWMSEGDAPSDPKLKPIGSASSSQIGLGVRVRPFIASWDGEQAASPAGLWLSAAGGGARTGGLTRPMVDVFAGWDLLLNQGRLGVGPTVGLVHVFQPNDELRPADANLLFVGVHAMLDPTAAPVDDDRDKDGIKNSVDSCPDDPEDKDGFQDEDGCPDLDNDKDGIPDTSDQCANDPEDKDGFEDEDGCPDLDNDKDGILDKQDKCPNEPEDKDGFEDEDGCPDLDNDQDGVPDAQDKCPDEKETMNGYADDDGCPDAEQVRVVGDKIVLDDKVHFATNSSFIRPASYPLLERVAKLIEDNPTYVHIEVQGHTDERGPEEFNQRLSEGRANSVMEFLISKGIPRERLSSKGFGESQPILDQSSERAWYMNRRVEFKVTREVKKVTHKGGPSGANGESSKGGGS
jgi:outer membrane protein OmpA-like peptidoglycan-associated protein